MQCVDLAPRWSEGEISWLLAPHDHNPHSHQGSGVLPLNSAKLRCINISAVRFEICEKHSKKTKASAKYVNLRERICSFLIDPFNDVLFNLR